MARETGSVTTDSVKISPVAVLSVLLGMLVLLGVLWWVGVLLHLGMLRRVSLRVVVLVPKRAVPGEQ